MTHIERHILIAGASGALGGAIARDAARRGLVVGVHCHEHAERAKSVAAECGAAGATAHVLQADLRVRDDARRVFDEFESACGDVPRLAVCAVGGARDEPLLRTSDSSFDEFVRLNLTAPMWLLRAACERWAATGGGHLVLLGSFAGSAGRAGGAAYAASKAALVGLARSVAGELGDRGVRVNVVVPPFVREGMGAAASEQFAAREIQRSLLGRCGDAGAFGSFVMDVVLADGITGQVISADSRIG